MPFSGGNISGQSVATIQSLNATGNVTSWGSIVEIGNTPLTSNIVITLPQCINNIGKEITFKRIDNTAFTVTISAFAGDTSEITTLSGINGQYGALTLVCVSTTKSEQVNNIGSTSVVGDYSGVEQHSATNGTNLTTVTSTNTNNTGTLLTTTSRFPLTGATIQGGMVVNTSNGTITVAKSGTYTIIVSVSIQSAGANGQWGQLVKNNTTIINTNVAYSQVASAGMQIVFNYTGEFVVGDFIDIRLSASSAGTIGVMGYSYSMIQSSGFIPVSGQSVDFRTVSTWNVSGITANTDAIFTSIGAGNIPYSSGLFTLTAGKTYQITGHLEGTLTANTGTDWIQFILCDSANAILPNSPTGIITGISQANNWQNSQTISTIFTPTVTTQVKLRLNNRGGTATFSTNGGLQSGIGCWMSVTQLGTTASLENTSVPISNLSTGGALNGGATINPYVLGFNVTQTTANQVLSIPNPTSISINRVIYINNTGTVSFTVQGFTISVGQSQGFIWNGTDWSNFTNNTNQNVLAEFGTLQIPTQTNSLTSTVPFTVSGSAFTLPSSGVWEISYNVMTSAPATIVTYSIVDSAGVAVSSSGSSAGFFNATAQTYEHLSKTFLVTTTGAKSLKMIVVAGNNQSVSINSATNDTIYNNPPGNSQISWKKIGGFLPISGGTTVDYLKVKRTTSSQIIALNTDILFNSTPTGNIPYNATTGLATLIANKTYRIRAVLVGRNDGTGTTGRYITYDIKTSANADLPATANPTQGVRFLVSSVNNEGGGSDATAEFTPAVNTDIKIRITGIDGNNWTLDTERSYLEITQLGTSATIITPISILQLDNSGATAQAGTTGTAGTGTGILWGTSMFTKGSKISFTVNNGTITLAGGINGTTYRLTGKAGSTGASGNGYIFYRFYNVTTASLIGSEGYNADPDNGASGAGWDEIPSPVAYAYITVPSGTTQQIRLTVTASSATPGNLRQQSGQTSCTIEEIEG